MKNRKHQALINFRMSLLCAVFIFFSTPIFVHSKSPVASGSGASIEMLSYSELMQLSHEKRVAYISGVRAILVDLSKRKDGRFSDSSPVAPSKLRSWLKGLESQFPEAFAQEPSASTSIFCSQDDSCRDAMKSCFEANQTVTWSSSMNSYICDTKRAFSGSFSTAVSVERRAVLWNEFQQNFKNPRTFGPKAVLKATSDSISETRAKLQRGLADSKVILGLPRAPRSSQYGLDNAPLGPIAKNSVADYVNAMATDNPTKYGCVSKHQTIGTGSQITRPCPESIETRIAKDFENIRAKENLIELSPRVAPAVAQAVAPKVAPEVAAEVAAEVPMASRTQPIQLLPPSGPVSLSVPETPSVETPPSADEKDIVVSRKISRDEIQALLEQKLNPNRVCEAESEKQGGVPMHLVTIPGKDYRYCMTDEAQRLYEGKKLTLDENDTGKPPTILANENVSQPKKPKARAPSAANGKPGQTNLSCAPVPEVCGDTKSVRSKIFQGELSCVFAGMISQLDPQNRKCAAVTEFKLDSATYKCDSGQTMCNPLLFGTVSSTKAICIGRGSDATAQCSKLSSPRDTERFLNRNETGLQNKWDDFRSQFAKVCQPDSVQAKFHCNECNIMRERLFALHARILSDPCGSRTTGDGAVDGRIRIRSTPTTR